MKKMINRDNIYAGILMKYDKRVTTFVVGTDGEEKTFVKDYWIPCRTILFSVDEDHKAHDLLYETLPCPVDDISGPYFEVNSGDYRIYSPTSLSELLTYFEYPKELSENDIRMIPRFFTTDFFRQCCHLFGYKELSVEDLLQYESIDFENNIALAYYFEKKYDKLRKKGLELYELEDTDNTELPYDYFEKLRLLAGKPLRSCKYYDISKKDIFKPSLKKEGYKKKILKGKR